MADIRASILRASQEASRVHKDLDISAISEQYGRVDVFKIFVDRDIPLMFRPLKGLLGAFLNDPSPGVLVTTQRPLAVQRFTAAHELGHAMLGHSPSLDDEEIIARLVSPQEQQNVQEIEANAFASELLMPKWLIASHARKQGWTARHFNEPTIVYQLSLRLGTSYSATSYALKQHKIISNSLYRSLTSVQPKAIKQSLVMPHQPQNWRGDAWVISEKDEGIELEGSRTDLIVLRLPEHSGSGYLWSLDQLTGAGLAVVVDKREGNPNPEIVDGVLFRTIIAEASEGAHARIKLDETRPWQQDAEPLNSVNFNLDLFGPYSTGLLPVQRQALLGAA